MLRGPSATPTPLVRTATRPTAKSHTPSRRLEAPAQLAPLVDPNVHTCGTVSPHGAAELAHEEERVFLVGMKSYGRAPTFLAMTGYEQARSVAAAR